jgi:HEAT repeat protein
MNRYVNYLHVVASAVLITTLHAYCSGGASQESPSVDEERVRQLLEVLGKKAPAIPVPKEIEQTKDRAAREAYWAQRQARFAAFDAQINAATDELAAMGNGIIDRLIREYHKPVGAPRHRIIVVLAKIGTSKARDALLDIATAKYNPDRTSYSSWAARNFVKIAPDKEAILQLLRSDDPEVIGVALQHLSGVAVDGRLLGSLRGFLQSTTYHLRTHAASVLVNDSSSALAGEKVAAILDSLRTVDDMPAANERFQSDVAGTLADVMYVSLIGALTKIQGATPSLLEAKDGMAGRSRAAVVVALGLRGESTVKQELCDLLQDPLMLSMTNIRRQAARALGIVGTSDDIPFLEQLVRDDPLEIVDFHGPAFEMVNGQYVSTGARMAPIRPESDPAWKTARRVFPVRAAAHQAIQAIKKRAGDSAG